MADTEIQLRSRLTRVAGEMDFSVDQALKKVRIALKSMPAPGNDLGRGWKKGMEDALRFLAPAEGAHLRFQKWLGDVMASDGVAFSDDERATFAGVLDRGAA